MEYCCYLNSHWHRQWTQFLKKLLINSSYFLYVVKFLSPELTTGYWLLYNQGRKLSPISILEKQKGNKMYETEKIHFWKNVTIFIKLLCGKIELEKTFLDLLLISNLII